MQLVAYPPSFHKKRVEANTTFFADVRAHVRARKGFSQNYPRLIRQPLGGFTRPCNYCTFIPFFCPLFHHPLSNQRHVPQEEDVGNTTK